MNKTTPSILKIASRLALAAAALAALPAPAQACSVPVFRYALERWQADLYEVDVFYRGSLAEKEHRRLDQLEEHAAINGGTANFETVRVDLDGEPDADLLELWQSLDDPALPWVVVRLPLPGGKRAVLWQGKLDELSTALFDSPARREIARRLLGGDSVVWLVAGDPDSAPVQRALATLEEQLPVLSEETPLPPGVGLPGSELLAPVPLEVRFSSLIVDITNPQEAWLARILRSQAPADLATDEPLAAAVFGRGRVLEIFPADHLDAEFLAGVCRFLCGACSCQVKQLNPGFDLVTATAWDEQLFAAGALEAPPESPELASTGASLEIPIPPGMPKDADEDATGAAAVSRGAVNVPRGSTDNAPDKTSAAEAVLPRWLIFCAVTCLLAASVFYYRCRGCR